MEQNLSTEKIFRKVLLSEKLPPLDKYVPMIDDHDEIIMYRRIEVPILGSSNMSTFYNMRDLAGDNTPHDNHPMIYWLEEVTIDELLTTSSRLKYLVDVLRTE